MLSSHFILRPGFFPSPPPFFFNWAGSGPHYGKAVKTQDMQLCCGAFSSEQINVNLQNKAPPKFSSMKHRLRERTMQNIPSLLPASVVLVCDSFPPPPICWPFGLRKGFLFRLGAGNSSPKEGSLLDSHSNYSHFLNVKPYEKSAEMLFVP